MIQEVITSQTVVLSEEDSVFKEGKWYCQEVLRGTMTVVSDNNKKIIEYFVLFSNTSDSYK